MSTSLRNYAVALRKAGVTVRGHKGASLIDVYSGMGSAAPAAAQEASKARADFRMSLR